jgi:regulator of cell morphogenesis and NO signaling
LDEELTQHLAKEEVILFPYVVKLERALESGGVMPHGCFGTVANPIAMMTAEHDAATGLMSGIHELSHHFTTPVGACPTYCAFYDGLKEFGHDLFEHIHVENNVLFPRAIELETRAAEANT